jgi:N-acetyl-anhydromuramyl-L-alanine amidase AmpD
MRVTGIPYIQGKNAYSDPDGTKFGIAIHNTSNTASAEAEASYATRRTDGLSSHFYCDNDSIIQSLDTTSRAGHAGSSEGNNHAVAVEITGVNGWSRTQWLNNVAWSRLGSALAQVVRFYGISVRHATVSEMRSNPKVKAFYSHDDMRRAWGGTTHTDPGGNFPWDKLFESVNAALFSTAGGDDVALTTNEYAEIVQGSLTDDNVLHWRLRAIQDSKDPANDNTKLGAPETPGLKQLGEGLTKLDEGLTALSQKVDTIAAGGVTHEALVAALQDPAVIAAMKQAAFEGAQQAETR